MHIICFSHLRWDFVYQRPQHLLTRAAKLFPVFYVEEPVFHRGESKLDIRDGGENITVLVPHLSHGLAAENNEALIIKQLADWDQQNSSAFIAWFYTPMAINLLEGFAKPELTVYDCMDELSGFKNAPAEISQKELELMELADIVFTGGNTLYEAKKHLHDNIHAFPSSIDKKHFGKAVSPDRVEPEDQKAIPHPRVGFFGVIDERMDIDLIAALASNRPEWQFILIGPVVKIDSATLPQVANLHYLGGKKYEELPNYLGGWDVALIPFAINESTKFISPTKTPEYLAGGIPVVSTPINDVINPYGVSGLVTIAANVTEFEAGIERSLTLKARQAWVTKVKSFLTDNSWDKTWTDMLLNMRSLLHEKRNTRGKQVITSSVVNMNTQLPAHSVSTGS